MSHCWRVRFFSVKKVKGILSKNDDIDTDEKRFESCLPTIRINRNVTVVELGHHSKSHLPPFIPPFAAQCHFSSECINVHTYISTYLVTSQYYHYNTEIIGNTSENWIQMSIQIIDSILMLKRKLNSSILKMNQSWRLRVEKLIEFAGFHLFARA